MPGLLPLSIRYDESRHLRRGFFVRLIGDKKLKHTLLPAVPRQNPEAEVIRIKYDIYCSGVNRIDSCAFLHSI